LDGLGLHSCPSERTCGLPSDYELFDPSFQTETEIEEFNWGITSYDNIAISMLTTFQISTLEGWTSIVYSYSDANMPPFVMFFFAVLVIYVGFFLLNLVLAAIWTSFTKIVNQEKQDEEVGQRRRYRENTSMLMASVARN
jgi:succinate dehydrogenase/fumarate reductase cytochrome b subunit